MTREKDDPEKRNLLNEPREEKKRRQYSVSKNKSDRRSCDSSNNSEHRKRGGPYKVSSTEQRAEFQNKAGSQNMTYQSEKKDSWWFWTFVSQQNCTPTPARKSEDTCSCVSCALKKIVSSEYACICCLLLLFTISIVVAFLVVFKSVPSGEECPCKTTTSTTTCAPKCKECKMGVVDSERLKRKIEMLNNKKLEKGFIGVDEFRKNDDKGYEDVPPGHIDIPGVSGIDFGPSFRELNSVDESEHKLSNDIDLSNVLDSDKNSNVLDGNGKLREFYKKLVQTDAKIKSLKKISESDVPYIEDDVQKSPERSRRSLKLYHYPKRYRVIRPRRSLFGKHHANETRKFSNKTRMKRFGNEYEEPTGLIIEKKKLLVQYKPVGKNRVPVKKCQHAPARTHTHEKQMMHPFYKNSQRLDLLLDKFLNKNLPEIMSDPFGLDDLFKNEKLNKPCKHPKPHKNINIIGNEQLVDQIPKPKFKFKNLKEEKFDSLKESMKLGVTTTPDVFKMLSPESTTGYEKDFFNHKIKMIGKEHKKIVTPSTDNFEVMLSVSTILSPDVQRVSKAPSTYQGMKVPMLNRIPNLRRLMQIENGEEEENLGYEDFKEVLTDEMENHDEMEKSGDRKKRDSGGENDQPAVKFKLNPPQGVHNPNWKGAMPLYPDEINSMITNKQMDVPKPTFEIQEVKDTQRKGRGLSDIEYVEDYLANEYNNLVQQAQAYSDYGVLDGKKESRNDKESPTVHTAPNNKIKLLADENVFKDGILDRLKRGRAQKVMKGKGEPRNEAAEKDLDITWTAQNGGKSEKGTEGIRFELQPTTNTREDAENNIQIMKIVSKHIKLKPKPGLNKAKPAYKNYAPYIQSTLVSKYPELGYIYNTQTGKLTTETSTVSKSLEMKDDENEPLIAITRGNRRLLSTKFESSSDFRDNKDTSGYRAGSTESNSSGIDRFVDKLELNNNMSEFSLSLKHFIEAARQKNIEVYSTPHSCISSSQAISEVNSEPELGTKSNTPNGHSRDSTDISNSDTEAADSIDTIDNSSEKLSDDQPENFMGKIVLSVNDPEFGLQNFNLMFDIPVVINSKEDLMTMNDNINDPNIYNQFEILSDSTIDAQVTEATYYSEDFLVKNSFPKRFKRQSTVTATWSDKTENTNPVEKYTSMIEKSDGKIIESPASVIVVSTNTLDRKSTVSAAPSTNQQQSAVNDSSSAVNSTKSIRSANYTLAVGDNMTLSDFFGVVSNWFKTLENGKIEKPRKSSGSLLTDMLLTLNNSSYEANITSTDSAYPMYDSDMIENIGHRSRVLLSIEDGVANVTERTVVNSTNVVNVTVAVSAVGGNVLNRITPTAAVVTGLRSNITTTHKNKDKKINQSPPKEETKQKIKAIVKRNADDSNLIFWNDIYDDEYGIQTDKMDSYMKSRIDDASMDKRIVKEKDFLKRSGRWVQNKIRKFARKMNPHSDAASLHSETKERVPRSIGRDNSFGLIEYPEIHDRIDTHASEREKEDIDEIEEDYPDVDQKSLFAALSHNMKEVCKKAAKAVQETRNVDYLHDDIKRNGLRDEESQQGSIANALMQQLVRLLTDLVDYQVQQKTCTKLTPELQTFLKWLTHNKDETEEPEKPSADQSELLFKTPTQDDEELIEELQDKPDAGSNIFQEKSYFPNAIKAFDKQNISPEDKTRYMDIIHSVQELMDQFDDMPDDDKSKMTGVKGYLENQMAYLNKQLSAYDLYAFIDKHNRKRRDILIMQHQTTKPRRRRKLHKFFKNFGRKHTRTTAGYNDEVQVTDNIMNKRTNKNEEINLSVSNKHQKLSKRNLKDVYYKAVAEAKKFSTAKSIHKKDEISSFGTSTVALKQH